MARRGAYAKGIVKRDQILETALAVIAREGYSGASIRQLADAVGLSQAGLLHYFDSKDELFTEVLRKRDEADAREFLVESDREGFDALLALIRHNADVPGLVQLYVRMSAAATDPTHLSHAFFRERTAQIDAVFAAAIAAKQEEGLFPPDLEPTQFARILVSLLDGLQTRCLMDPGFDMIPDIRALLSAFGIPLDVEMSA